MDNLRKMALEENSTQTASIRSKDTQYYLGMFPYERPCIQVFSLMLDAL